MADKSHVVVNFQTDRVECRRCGQSWPLPMPMGITAFVAVLKAYESDHEYCESAEAGRR